MSSTLVLLQLAGNVALLLWGMHMVQTGILRAFGSTLRGVLFQALDSRWKAFLAGLGVTAITQSSTATVLMASGFVASGLMALVPALALSLGANVGSTIIVQLVSFNVIAVAPILILVGVVAFKKGAKTRARDTGRICIGLGLVLMALHAILLTIGPVEEGRAAREVLTLLAHDPIMNIAIGALLTWVSFSSVATVLLVMSLATAGAIEPKAILSLVLGANLGIVISQYSGAGTDPVARRLALANLIVRGAGCIAVLPFLNGISDFFAHLGVSPARQAANFHTLFNLILAAAFIGFLNPLARLCERLLPARAATEDIGAPQYLVTCASDTPSIVIANAQREVLRLVDLIEAMLQSFLDALNADDRKKLAEVRTLDDAIDKLHSTIKAHLIETTRRQDLTETDLQRCSEMLGFTINLEQVGDVVDVSLRELAARKIKNRYSFANEGTAQIEDMYQHVRKQLRLAVAVFLHRDENSARLLVDEKLHIRELAQTATSNHFARLREGRPESIESSALYLDIIRDLKRITAHLASVAYPILEERGALLRSRLLDSADKDAPQSIN